MTLFFVKRAGPFLVFFLFVGTAFGLVATSTGAAGALRGCCLGAFGLKDKHKHAVNLNSTRACAPAKGRVLTGQGLLLVQCSSSLGETLVAATEMTFPS